MSDSESKALPRTRSPTARIRFDSPARGSARWTTAAGSLRRMTRSRRGLHVRVARLDREQPDRKPRQQQDADDRQDRRMGEQGQEVGHQSRIALAVSHRMTRVPNATSTSAAIRRLKPSVVFMNVSR